MRAMRSRRCRARRSIRETGTRGIVHLDSDLTPLTSPEKGSPSAGDHCGDRLFARAPVQWRSRTRTRRDSRTVRKLSGTEPGLRVHLVFRSGKLRNGKAAPFPCCGQPVSAGQAGRTADHRDLAPARAGAAAASARAGLRLTMGTEQSVEPLRPVPNALDKTATLV